VAFLPGHKGRRKAVEDAEVMRNMECRKALGILRSHFSKETTLGYMEAVVCETLHTCPKCQGHREVRCKFQSLAHGVGEQREYNMEKCDLCEGKGWVNEEYEPIIKHTVVGYKKKGE